MMSNFILGTNIIVENGFNSIEKVHFHKKKSLKSFICFLLATFLLTLQLSAQKNVAEDKDNAFKIVNDSINRKVDIEFKAERKVYNLLVLITDSVGHTMFLDNQYNFKGLYKRTVDSKKLSKGKYSLKIIKDEEKYQKKFIVH